jgi:hypothetical protein
MPREKLPQIFARLASLTEPGKKTLNGIRYIRGSAAITNRPGNRSKLSDASTDAEVISVDHPAIYFDFLALDADIGDPMLPATIGAASYVYTKLFLKIREPLLELVGKPASESFGFGQR